MSRLIKSDKALNYVEQFRLQCPRQTPLLEGDLWMVVKIWYASRRPDLDESLILDAMQGLVYENDRQVKRRYAEWGLDRDNPRAEIIVGELAPVVQKSKRRRGLKPAALPALRAWVAPANTLRPTRSPSRKIGRRNGNFKTSF